MSSDNAKKTMTPSPPPSTGGGSSEEIVFDTRRSDIPKKIRKPLLDCVRILYRRHVLCTGLDKEEEKAAMKLEKHQRWEAFAEVLQESLGRGSLGTCWHVLIGVNVGFACKKRDKTVAMFKAGKIVIVCWRSPGVEPPTPGITDNGASEDPSTSTAPAVKLRVLKPEGSLEEGSRDARALELLRDVLQKNKANDVDDVQKQAQAIRNRLTAELGTIWHVVIGHELAVLPGGEPESHVHVIAGKNRIVCFQHKQFDKPAIDFDKLLKALPYLLLLLFCLSYSTLHSVCNEEPQQHEQFKWWLRRNVCISDWETKVNALGIAVLVAFFVSRKANFFGRGNT